PGGRTLCSGRVALADLGEWGPKVRLGLVSAWTMDPLDYYRERMHTRPLDPALPSRARDESAPVEHLASGSALIAQLLKACLDAGVDIRLSTPAERLVVEDGRVVGATARSGE